MIAVYVVIFGRVLLLGVTVVMLFGWAIKTGQMHNFQRGATSIFDDEEPQGEQTDWFPDRDRERARDEAS